MKPTYGQVLKAVPNRPSKPRIEFWMKRETRRIPERVAVAPADVRLHVLPFRHPYTTLDLCYPSWGPSDLMIVSAPWTDVVANQRFRCA